LTGLDEALDMRRKTYGWVFGVSRIDMYAMWICWEFGLFYGVGLWIGVLGWIFVYK
jgi:hypothetical protein